ncbi:MAG: beta-propeller fold lactonase family protein [Candidatus Sulfopaludibacter sp.]|nr:beta-propeller fold lactonase family protein [Candidatus Sulfopaludibacter sp.]
MSRVVYGHLPGPALGLILSVLLSGAPAHAQTKSRGPSPQPAVHMPPTSENAQALPNMGQQITPLAPRGSRFAPMDPGLAYDPADPAGQGWLASQAVTTVVSPDHKTLLALTSGYNRINTTYLVPPAGVPTWYAPDSTEYVFVYDISTPVAIKKQVLKIPNTYNGIVFDPSGLAFYVSGGPSDNVHVVTLSASGTWAEQPTMMLPLGHASGVGLGVLPCAAGLALSQDGQTLVVVNYYNDSITVFRGGLGNWSRWRDLDLRPGLNDPSQSGVPGGAYPFWVAVKGNGAGAVAYISSIRDREIVVANLSGPRELFNPAGRPSVATRIHVKGQPNKMTLNAAQTLLYVAEDQSDTVDVIETATNTIVETIPVIAPPSLLPAALASYTGANPNSVTLSPDEKQLYVTNGNLNAIAVVSLGGTNKDDQVVGLIPTGWYPNSVSFSGDGGSVYVVNAKSPTGPNPAWCYGGYGPVGTISCMETNQYNPQLTKAGFQSFPRPTPDHLATLTAQVATNNRFASTESDGDAAIMAAVRKGIQHVIFIIKENRTYDQILGDLEKGNGDPDLAEFPENITPNQHNLARNFVTLDNFMDTAEVSYDGWLWTTSARAPDVVERQYPVAYAYRGTSADSEGTNRNVNVAIPTLAGRVAGSPLTPKDPNVLPGQTNVAAPDGPNNEINTGYLWDAAFRANLTVRNYGFFADLGRYNAPAFSLPVVRDPFATGTVVAIPTNAALTPFTDQYFRGFDNVFPDYYRYTEWARDFDTNYAKGGLPSLSLVRFMHDHTGNFDTAIDGVNVPEKMVADNDYAVGLLIEKISHSIYANNTLIFVIEDDAQDGGDHVDSHRSIAFVAGAYVKRGALVSTQYNTIDYLRTIEEVLGLPPMNLNDALARPMAGIFNPTPSPWTFTAIPSALLYATSLPLPPRPVGLIVPKVTHNAKYWAKATKGMDFDEEDRVDPLDFNHILWKGLMGKKPYPARQTGLDLRLNREELLARYRLGAK